MKLMGRAPKSKSSSQEMNPVTFPHPATQIYALEVSNTEKLLLLAMLFLKADRSEVRCAVSEMEKLGFDRTTLKKSLKNLIRGGYLQRTYPNGRRKNPYWRLTLAMQKNKSAALPHVLSCSQGSNRPLHFVPQVGVTSPPVANGEMPPRPSTTTHGSEIALPVGKGGYLTPVFESGEGKEGRGDEVRKSCSPESHPMSSFDSRDLPMLEALAIHFVDVYPRKSKLLTQVLAAFCDCAINLSASYPDKVQTAVDAALYILQRARRFAEICAVCDNQNSCIAAPDTWLAQQHLQPDWQWAGMGGNCATTINEADEEASFDQQLPVRAPDAAFFGTGESRGDSGRIEQSQKTLWDHSAVRAPIDLVDVAHGGRTNGAHSGFSGRQTSSVLPDRRDSMTNRLAR